MKDPEKRRQQAKAWRQKNCGPEYYRLRYLRDKERMLEYQKRYRKENRQLVADRDRKKSWRKQGIDTDAAEAMWKGQKLCAICGDTNTRLCIDHNHTTGAIRGILCYNCNLGIGNFRDKAELVQRALIYLEGDHMAAVCD